MVRQVALRQPLPNVGRQQQPAEHAGQGSFSFRVAFSEGISVSYKTVRDASFTGLQALSRGQSVADPGRRRWQQ